MGKIISILNHKGGVGKTTTAAALGASLANRGYKTLLVDLDAQCNLTGGFLGVEEPERTIYEALRERRRPPIISLRETLDLIPASLDLAGAEIELSSAMEREFILRDLLEPLSSKYDYILIDCPPSLGLLSINALCAAAGVIIPLTAEAYPARGLQRITELIGRISARLNPGLKLDGVLITRFNSRKLNKVVEESLREKFGEAVFNTKIRENISIAEAPLYSLDIFSYSPESNGAQDYAALTEEFLARE